MISVMLSVLIERALATFLALAPFLLAGLLLAAAAHVLIGPRLLRKALAEPAPDDPDTAGNTRWKLALRGTAWGFLLPACAVGAVALALVLWRAGVRGRGFLALLLAAAATNPLAALALAGHIEVHRAAIILTTLLLTIFLLALLTPTSAIPHTPIDRTPANPSHPSTLIQLLHTAGSLVPGPTALAVALTVLSACLMAVVVPPGFIGHLFCMEEGGDPAAYVADGIAWDHLLLALPVAFFAYVPPDLAATQAASVAHLRALPGAAVLWILAGAAAGPALLVSLHHGRSLLKPAVLVSLVLAAAFTAAVAVHKPLQDAPPIPEDTHAFDRHGRPYRGNWHEASIPQSLSVAIPNLLTTPSLAATLAIPGLWAFSRRRLPQSQTPHPPLLERTSPAQRLAMTSLTAAILLTSGAYVLYPSPSLTVEQMRDPDALVAIAIRRGDLHAAHAPLARLEVLVSRLRPGGTLRPLHRPPHHAQLAHAAESAVERLRHGLHNASPDLEARSLALTFALRDLYAAWQSPNTPAPPHPHAARSTPPTSPPPLQPDHPLILRPSSRSGGTGRRAGLRSPCRKA